MRRLSAKALALLLAVAMLLSLGLTALADEEIPGTTAVSEDTLLIAPAPDDTDILIAPAPDGEELIAPAADLAGKTVILHTNDVHGAIEGYAVVAALKAEYEARGAEVILVDAGDYSRGTTYVNVSKGADAVTLMNAAGYDIVTVGNHELDHGYAQLKENMESAEFQVLCANVLDADGAPIFDANCTYETASGLKVGFFGLLTPESKSKVNPALIKGLQFLDGDALYACIQEQLDALADADVVIALCHLGVDAASAGHRSNDVYTNTTGIDMIIDGHSHTVMTAGANQEPIQSTGTAMANVGVIVIDDATGAIESNELIPITEDLARDPEVDALAQEIIDRVMAEYGAVFATSEVTLNGAKAPNGNRDSETNSGDLIADAMVWQILQNKDSLAVEEDMVIAITNGGGIRAAIKPGDVTKSDINTVLPFGNTLTVIYVSGAELLEVLEASTFCTPAALGGFPQVSGIEFTVDTTKAYDANDTTYPDSTYYGPASINRVTVTSVNGKALDAEATYAVITNNFCAEGGDTYYAFAATENRFDTGISLDEVVMNYITEVLDGVIGEEYAEPQGRITVRVNPFTDVAADTYYTDAVLWAVDNGITKGTTDTTFTPNADVTREQAMTFIYRYLRNQGGGFSGDWMFLLSFDDAEAISDWANEPVHWGVMNQILQGDTNNCFRPADAVTREQLVTILYRFADAMGFDVSVDPDTNFLSYNDVFSVSDYARTAMFWALENGILTGDDQGNLLPQASASRAQFVTILHRFVSAAA